jgi:hypothetical protein
LISGNVSLAAFVVGWLSVVFDQLQHWRGGMAFPNFGSPVVGAAPPPSMALQIGELVVVRAAHEIRQTLDERSMHRGLYFEPDMLKHCGRRYHVQAEVNQLIDIVSGAMLRMKTPAYLLEDVFFSGERQRFNAQCEPLLWRSLWLRHRAD